MDEVVLVGICAFYAAAGVMLFYLLCNIVDAGSEA